MTTAKVLIAARKYKSQWAAFFLVFFFGSLGLLYATILGALLSLVIDIVVGVFGLYAFFRPSNFENIQRYMMDIIVFVLAVVSCRIFQFVLSYLAIKAHNQRVDAEILSHEGEKPGTVVESNKPYLFAAAALAIVLLALGFVRYSYRGEPTPQGVSFTQQLYQADSSKAELQERFNEVNARLDDMTGKSAKLDKVLKRDDAAITSQKKRIIAILVKQDATAQDIDEGRQIIHQLNDRIDGYNSKGQ